MKKPTELEVARGQREEEQYEGKGGWLSVCLVRLCVCVCPPTHSAGHVPAFIF